MTKQEKKEKNYDLHINYILDKLIDIQKELFNRELENIGFKNKLLTMSIVIAICCAISIANLIYILLN